MTAGKQIRRMGGYLIVALVFLMSTGASAVLAAWPVMIALGVGHSVWGPCPPLGFLQVAVVIWAIRQMTPYRMKFTEPNPE